MSGGKRFVTVYRGARAADIYLYVERGTDPQTLPEALQKQLGTLTEVLQFVLTPDRTLARTTPEALASALDSDGFYLQLPPSPAAAPRL